MNMTQKLLELQLCLMPIDLFSIILEAISRERTSSAQIRSWLLHWNLFLVSNIFLAWHGYLFDFRGNNLCKDDADSLKYALIYMPNLEILDLSDNPIEDDGIRSVVFVSYIYFEHSSVECLTSYF